MEGLQRLRNRHIKSKIGDCFREYCQDDEDNHRTNQVPLKNPGTIVPRWFPDNRVRFSGILPSDIDRFLDGLDTLFADCIDIFSHHLASYRLSGYQLH